MVIIAILAIIASLILLGWSSLNLIFNIVELCIVNKHRKATRIILIIQLVITILIILLVLAFYFYDN